MQMNRFNAIPPQSNMHEIAVNGHHLGVIHRTRFSVLSLTLRYRDFATSNLAGHERGEGEREGREP